MSLLYSQIATATVVAGTNTITVEGMDISGVFQGMVVNLGANDRVKGDGYIVANVLPNGTSGGTLTTVGAIAVAFDHVPFVIDTRDFNGTAPNYLIAMYTLVLQSLMRLTSPLTNLFSGSRVLALDKDSGGAISRLLFAIAGRTWAGLEQRTLTYTPSGGATTTTEVVSLRGYADGTTPVDSIMVDLGTGGVDFNSVGAGLVTGSTVDLGSVPNRKISVSGDGTINSLGSTKNKERIVTFFGNITLKFSANLITHTEADYAPANGEAFLATSGTDGVWRLRAFQSRAAIRGDVVQSLSSAEKVRALTNIGVYDTFYKPRNRVVNPGMRVSQEIGDVGIILSSGVPGGSYICDGFIVGKGANEAIGAQRATLYTPGGSANRLRIVINQAGVMSPDNAISIATYLEGYRVQDFKLGSPSPLPFVIRFGLKAPAGEYSYSIRNQALSVGYVDSFKVSQSEANVDIVRELRIPPNTAGGLWDIQSFRGLILNIGFGSGDNLITNTRGWQAYGAQSKISLPNMTQLNLAQNAVVEIFDVGIYPGLVAPPFELPDFALDIFECQRYYEKSYPINVNPGTPGFGTGLAHVVEYACNYPGIQIPFKVEKRVIPSVTFYSPNTGAPGKIYNSNAIVDYACYAGNVDTNNTFVVVNNVTVGASNSINAHFVASCRL